LVIFNNLVLKLGFFYLKKPISTKTITFAKVFKKRLSIDSFYVHITFKESNI